MTQLKHRDCFATMLPEGSENMARTSSAGKALAWESTPSGGLAAPGRRVLVDMDAWDDCRSCDEFESCYRLCMAKLSLAAAIRSH